MMTILEAIQLFAAKCDRLDYLDVRRSLMNLFGLFNIPCDT